MSDFSEAVKKHGVYNFNISQQHTFGERNMIMFTLHDQI